MKRRNKKAIGILFAAMLLSTLLILIPSVSGDNSAIVTQPIELTYDFAEPVIGKTVIGLQEYDTVSIPGCDMHGAPGEPVLPFKTARILIPYGEEVQDIQVVPGEEIYLGEFYIEPGQEQVPISFEGPITSTPPNETIYNSTDIYPKDVYSKGSVQGMGGYQILIMNLYPVKYSPKARKLSYFESMQVIVNTTASSPDKLFRGSPEDRTRVAEIIDNPVALSTYNSAHVINATQQSELEVTYDFAEPAIDKPVIGKIDIGEQEYDTVSIPGCDMYGAPGEPVLPFKTARILIPYGEEVQDIQVILGKEIYLGEFYIEPGQEQVPISFTGPVAPTQPDEVIYNSDKAFPEEDYLEVSVQGMKGYQILILNLYPVKYVPKARKLSCFESMQVVVSTTASAPSELFRGVPGDRAEAAEIIDNREALSTYDHAKASKPERSPLSPTQQYDYVIITNEALEGTGGPSNFQALRDSKIANGLSATIVTTEWIYANYGSTSAVTSPPRQREMSVENVPAFAAGSSKLLAASAPISEGLGNVSKLPVTYEIPPVAAGDYEIKYDDGTAETGWTVTDVGLGSVFAVCFTPPEYPARVKTARLFIYDYGTPSTPIKIHVYEQATGSSAPGAELIAPFIVTPPGPGWYDIDLSGYNIAINSGSFAIGEEPTLSYSVYLGEDESGPIDYRSWFYDVGTEQWDDWATDSAGDLMIRAIVETGLDEQTMIRNFIIDAYSDWGTRYVLLGGDGDGADVGGESGDAIIPARGFWTGLTSDECTPPNIPADMYYSCLDGTFDYNLNGIYGEPWDGPGGGEVDLFAEVYVGRAPVDSSTEVSNFVKKTLAYESAAFLPKALMVGENMTGIVIWIPWGGDYKDEVKDGSSNYGYTTVGFPQPPFVVDTLYDDRDYPGNDWPKSELINRLNNNPNIVNHMGHAGPTSVMKLSNSDVDGLTNSKYFFGYTQGCYAGSFDNRWSNCNYGSSDCILEHFVVDDHGAFAFIGNSRYGWGNRFTTNGASQRFDRQFWDAVFGEELTRIGVANADSKEDNVGLIGDDYIRFCYYELNLFGDPAIEFVSTGVEDTVAFRNGWWYVSKQDHTGTDWTKTFSYGIPGDTPLIGDIDNNGVEDAVIFRNGLWYVSKEDHTGTDWTKTVSYGIPGDIPVIGDIDNNGIVDAVIFRNGLWYVSKEDRTGTDWTKTFSYGIPGDIPVIGDIDNNGVVDAVIFRNGLWYVSKEDHTGTDWTKTFRYGISGDKPVIGDIDNNGIEDAVIFRNGLWYVSKEDHTGTDWTKTFRYGISGDKPVIGDIDNNGIEDAVIFRNGLWYVSKEDHTGTDWTKTFSYGIPGDKPVIGDIG